MQHRVGAVRRVVHGEHDVDHRLEGAGGVDAAEALGQQLAQVVAGQVFEDLERDGLAGGRLARVVRHAPVEGVDAAADRSDVAAVEVHEDRVALVPGAVLPLTGVTGVETEDLDGQGRGGDSRGHADSLVDVGLAARAEHAGEPVALL